MNLPLMTAHSNQLLRRSTDGGVLAAAARDAEKLQSNAEGSFKLSKSVSHIGGVTEHERRVHGQMEEGRKHHHVNTLGKLKVVSRAIVRTAIVKRHVEKGHHVSSALAAADEHHDELHRQVSMAASTGACTKDVSRQFFEANMEPHGKEHEPSKTEEHGLGALTTIISIAHALRLDSLLSHQQRKQVERKHRVLGHGKYRTSSFLSIETLWLWTLGLTAEAGANVGLVMICKILPVEALLQQLLPAPVDVQLTILNLSGAMFDGAAVYLGASLQNLYSACLVRSLHV